MRRCVVVAAGALSVASSPLPAQRTSRDTVPYDSTTRRMTTPRPALPPDEWFGDDKVKHAFLSGLTYALGYAGARTVGVPRRGGLAVAVVPTTFVAIGKELRDRRVTGRFSLRDLAADALGASAYAAIVARTSR